MRNLTPAPRPARGSDPFNPKSERLAEARRSRLTATDDDDLLAPGPLDLEHDAEWQSTLTAWLGRVAAVNDWCTAPEYVTDLPPLVARTAELVNDVFKFVTDRTAHEASEATLSEFMAGVGWYLAEAGRIGGRRPTGGWWRRLIGRKADVPVAACGALVRELPVVLERAAALLGSRFRQQELSLAWLSTTAAFLAELKRTTAWTGRLVAVTTPTVPKLFD